MRADSRHGRRCRTYEHDLGRNHFLDPLHNDRFLKTEHLRQDDNILTVKKFLNLVRKSLPTGFVVHHTCDVHGPHLGRVLAEKLNLVQFHRLDAALCASFLKAFGDETCIEIQEAGEVHYQGLLSYLLIL